MTGGVVKITLGSPFQQVSYSAIHDRYFYSNCHSREGGNPGRHQFIPGQTYAGCQIDLPEVGKINVTITVKNLVSISPKPGQTIKRVGCGSRNLDNASSILLQRYVTKMQLLKTDT